MNYSHQEVNNWLNDAIAKVSALNSATDWVSIGNGWWNIRDEAGKLIGWVEANVCCKSGIVLFKYRKDRTYFSLDNIEPIRVDATILTDNDELQKLVDFDAAISGVYAITDDDTQYTADGDVHGGENDSRPVAGSPP